MTIPHAMRLTMGAGGLSDRRWLSDALARLEADVARSADTHLLRHDVPGTPGLHLYFKDESIHPTGSLKHRLARSLFLYALCNGRLTRGQTVLDASSGSTAISEAYFAHLLGLPYVAVMPTCTAARKIAEIEALGGRCELVEEAAQVPLHARKLVEALGACHLDQFANAERATDWRGNNNIAESIIGQLRLEPEPRPAWIVCGAGTGGTSATIGRYLRYRRLETRLCIADPQGAAFARLYAGVASGPPPQWPTRIEGIGRAHVEASFVPQVVDEVIAVPDEASIAATWLLAEITGRRFGGSSGTNLYACLALAERMRAEGRIGPLVTLLCDRGERYDDTLFNRAWLAAEGLEIDPWLRVLRDAWYCGAALPIQTRPRDRNR